MVMTVESLMAMIKTRTISGREQQRNGDAPHLGEFCPGHPGSSCKN
jgi:hypothetical protein